MATRISILIPLLVITLCCMALVEGGYTALEYLLWRPKARMASPASEGGPVLASTKVANDQKHGYQIILTRNLFAASANDHSRAAAAADNLDSLEATSLGIVLMGTIDDSVGGNRAIILDKKTLEQQIYRQGERVQEAIIKEIRRGKAVLSLHGRDEILDMSEAAKMRAAQNAIAASQAQPLPQDTVQAGVDPTAMAQLPVMVPPQQGPPLSAAEVEQLAGQSAEQSVGQSAKTKRVQPPIIRPVRSPESN